MIVAFEDTYEDFFSKTLDLSANDLTKMPSINYQSLETLNITSNELMELTCVDEMENTTFAQLENLFISKNELFNFPHLNCFQKLKRLCLAE